MKANDEQNIFVTTRVPTCRGHKQSHWTHPPIGWLKCNFDCSFRSMDVDARVVWIVRDDKGKYI